MWLHKYHGDLLDIPSDAISDVWDKLLPSSTYNGLQHSVNFLLKYIEKGHKGVRMYLYWKKN